MIDKNPSIILVNPQMAENIGTSARAMMNCALYDMRLVLPKENHLSQKAIAASSGAEEVLHNAKVFESIEDAVSDLNCLFATTARRRDMIKEVLNTETAAKEIKQNIENNIKCGVLFGPERTGLENDFVSMSDYVIEIPLNPKHCSLNLAQAVLLVGYEWFKTTNKTEERVLTVGKTYLATKEELFGFFKHLEDELEECGYLRLEDKRPRMVRSLRNIFERAKLTEQEIRSLHGVVQDLSTNRRRKAKEGKL